MIKPILLFFGFICVANFIYAHSPKLQWTKGMDGTGHKRDFSSTNFALGNVCVIGTFQGESDFDPFIRGYNLTSYGSRDIFVARFAQNNIMKSTSVESSETLIKVTDQEIPPWQRAGDTFQGYVAVSTQNPSAASWHLEIDVMDINGKYQSAIIYPSTTSSTQKFYSTDPQLNKKAVEGTQFEYYAILDADKTIKAQVRGATKIIHKRWENENVVYYNDQSQYLNIPLKYIIGTTSINYSFSRVKGTSHESDNITSGSYTENSNQSILLNSSDLNSINPGVFKYQISYNGVSYTESGQFDLTKVGKLGGFNSINDTLIVLIGGNRNNIENNFQNLVNDPNKDFSIAENFRYGSLSSVNANYNTWYIAQSNENLIEKNAFDLGIALKSIFSILLANNVNCQHLFLLAHSKGGLEVRALLSQEGVSLDGSQYFDFTQANINGTFLKNILDGVIFLATPHKGVGISTWLGAAGNAGKELALNGTFVNNLLSATLFTKTTSYLNITGNDLYADQNYPLIDGLVPISSSEKPLLTDLNGSFTPLQEYDSYNVPFLTPRSFGLHTVIHHAYILNHSFSCDKKNTILEKIFSFIRGNLNTTCTSTGLETVYGKLPSTYKTTTIGNQIWMAQNLDVSTYQNGDPIPQVQDAKEWSQLKTGAWCYYNNDPENGKTYGKLYNWYAVHDPRGLAPSGYHIPSDQEWTTLINNFRNYVVAGGQLKEAGFDHWLSPNITANNSSRFTALPGGVRDDDGKFRYVREAGYWWSTTPFVSHFAWSRALYYNHPHIDQYYYDMKKGLSVRCLKY